MPYCHDVVSLLYLVLPPALIPLFGISSIFPPFSINGPAYRVFAAFHMMLCFAFFPLLWATHSLLFNYFFWFAGGSRGSKTHTCSSSDTCFKVAALLVTLLMLGREVGVKAQWGGSERGRTDTCIFSKQPTLHSVNTR